MRTIKKQAALILAACMALLPAQGVSAAERTLSLTEDWRLTSDLDLAVPANDTLKINGVNGESTFYIYEMGGALVNSGAGLADISGVTVYAAGDGAAAGSLAELAEKAAAVTITAPAAGATALTLPSLGGGFTVSIFSSDNPSVIALDGKITPSSQAATVNLVLSVTGNGGIARTPSIAVTVPAAASGGNNNSSGGSGRGGGSSSSSSPPASGAVTVAGNGGTGVSATADAKTGEVKLSSDARAIDALVADAVKTAQAKAEADGAAAVAPVVTLDLSGISGAKSALLDTAAAGAFATAKADVVVKLPEAWVTLGAEALSALAETAKPVSVSAPSVSAGELTGMQAAQVRGLDKVVNIDIFAGGVKADVPVAVTLPYALKPGQSAGGVRVWHLSDAGALARIDGSYDAAAGLVTFAAPHQSYFTVGYDPVALWENAFDDVSEAEWYYDAVAYANYYGLFSGHGDGTFDPGGGMTRAMFVTVLKGMAGNSARPSADAAFADVEPGAWYHGAAAWASENGILDGIGTIGGGLFEPSRAVTRQEMAAMLYNFAGYMGYELPVYREAPPAEDAAEWAREALGGMYSAGVLNGDGGGLSPQRESTRAEVAQMFKDFLRLAVAE